MSVQSYRDLIAWQKGIKLVTAVYQVSSGWPRGKLYGLTNQLRRAAVSVPANIAEGHGRYGPKEYLHHLSIANGSLFEAETHLVIARNLDYISEPTLSALLAQSAEVGRLIHGLMRSLRPATLSPDPYLLTPDS